MSHPHPPPPPLVVSAFLPSPSLTGPALRYCLIRWIRHGTVIVDFQTHPFELASARVKLALTLFDRRLHAARIVDVDDELEKLEKSLIC